MTESEWRDTEISLFAVGNTLLRNRWRITAWALAGGILAGLMVFSRPAVYVATESFIPQGAQGARSDLSGLAGQLGLSLPSGDPSSSPDFYVELLDSPARLELIVRDTFPVQELGGRRIAFMDLFHIRPGPPRVREESAVQVLRGLISSSVSKSTGIIGVSVATQWPSASVGIVTALVNGVDEFNKQSRQSQAAIERKFVEGRLAVASTELQAAENRMQSFLQANHQIGNSPELTFEREHLQRDVTLRQDVVTSLTQSDEEVRLREVRDTPVITIFEAPTVPTKPEARGRLKVGLLGLIVGGFIGVMLAFGSEMLARTRLSGSPEANEFVGTLNEVKGQMLKPVRWVTGRGRS